MKGTSENHYNSLSFETNDTQMSENIVSKLVRLSTEKNDWTFLLVHKELGWKHTSTQLKMRKSLNLLSAIGKWKPPARASFVEF